MGLKHQRFKQTDERVSVKIKIEQVSMKAKHIYYTFEKYSTHKTEISTGKMKLLWN